MDKTDIEAIVPLSPIQDDLVRGGIAPHGGGRLSCTLLGDLDLARLDEAWQRTAMRHAALRTVLVEKGLKHPVQVVLKRARRVVLADEPEHPEPAWEQLLVRPAVRRLGDARHRFECTFHSAVADAQSMAIVARDLLAAYHEPASSPALPPPYAEFVAWVRRQSPAAAEVAFEAASVSCGELFGHTGSDDRPAGGPPSITRPAIAYRTLPLEAEVATRVAEQSHLLDAALALVIAAYTERTTVAYAAVVSARPASMARSVGAFTHAIPVHLTISGDPSLSAWRAGVAAQRAARGAYAYVSTQAARAWSGLAPRDPLLDVGIAAKRPLGLSDGPWGPVIVAESVIASAPQLGLCLSSDLGTEPELVAAFDPVRFDPRRVERILSHVRLVLTASPEERVSALITRIGPELGHRIAEWNDTTRPVPAEAATAGFDRRARIVPDSPAVRDPWGDTSYGVLDRQAELIANQLRGLGTADQTPVALFASAGRRQIAGMLGILRAGGTVVIIDPDWPFPRVCFVLADIEPALIVTEPALEERLPSSWAQVVLLEDAETMKAPLPAAAAEDAAAFITFGAEPEEAPGVVLEHRSVVTSIQRIATDDSLDATDRLGWLRSVGDPAGPAELLAALGAGCASSFRPMELSTQSRRCVAGPMRRD